MRKKATRFDWCNQNVNGFVAKMHAVELNSLSLVLGRKSCFSGHVNTPALNATSPLSNIFKVRFMQMFGLSFPPACGDEMHAWNERLVFGQAAG